MSSTFVPSSAAVRQRFLPSLVLWLALPMAVLVPLWVVAGRALFGIGGQMVLWLGISLGPALLVLLLLTGIKLAEAARQGVLLPVRAVVAPALAWLAAIAFGFTVPDFGGGAGDGTSVVSLLAGPSALGMSTALCNPCGIIAMALTIASTVFAFRAAADGRKAADPATGPGR
ncbi:MAG: hypothetical protein ACQEXN_11275 [Actinomycetota bacterium]